jgi:DNA-repair protein XRCC3
MQFSVPLQVSDVVGSVDAKADQVGHMAGLQLGWSGRHMLPALGLAWSNCVNSRLFLSRCVDACGAMLGCSVPGDDGQASLVRCMQVVFSPCIPQARCFYIVALDGVHGICSDRVQSRVQGT